MSINRNEITKEMLEKAIQCETPEELVELAKTNGIEITVEEASAYLDELSDFELEAEDLNHVAGGKSPGGGDRSIPPESRY